MAGRNPGRQHEERGGRYRDYQENRNRPTGPRSAEPRYGGHPYQSGRGGTGRGDNREERRDPRYDQRGDTYQQGAGGHPSQAYRSQGPREGGHRQENWGQQEYRERPRDTYHGPSGDSGRHPGYGQEGQFRTERGGPNYEGGHRSEKPRYQGQPQQGQRFDRPRHPGPPQQGQHYERPRFQGQQPRYPGQRSDRDFQGSTQPPRDNRGRQEGGGFDAAGQLAVALKKMKVNDGLGKQLFLNGRRGELTVEDTKEQSFHGSNIVTKGSQGQRVKLYTNLFNFELTANTRFHQYAITYTPTVESTRLKRKLIRTLEEHLDMKSRYVTDGSSLFTTARFNEELLTNMSATLGSSVYRVDMKHVSTIQPNSGHVIQILNIVFGSVIQNICGWTWSRGNYYNYDEMSVVNGTSVSAIPGFFTSILEYESGTRLMLDVTHKIIDTSNALAICNGNVMSMRSKLIGKIVYTCYNAKTYKVDDVDMNKTPRHVFACKKRGDITIMEYYKEKYNVDIQDDTQPLLVVKPNRREQRAGAPDIIYLVPELCLITGIDEEKRKNFNFMKSLGEVTKPKPNERVNKMNEFASKIVSGDSAGIFNAFGIGMSSEMLSLEGRILPGIPQNLNQVSRSNLLIAQKLQKWQVFHPQDLHVGAVTGFLESLEKPMMDMGMQPSRPIVRSYNNLNDLQHQLESVPGNTDMVLVVIRNSNKTDYSTVKKLLCVRNPIPSQVITSRLINKKPNFSVSSKVALQMNCKMGGAGWSIKNMKTKETMIIGVDTYHDSETRGASYMGVVASLNEQCTKYYTTWAKHNPGREIAVSFRALITQCLKAYHSEHNKPCKRIVIYRDGVGDGQLAFLMEVEVKETEKAIKEFGWNTKVVFVVVKKRVHSRFFCTDRVGYCNPPKGTVIDSEVTRPGWMDFYLINQEVNASQGTVTPTHFNVVLNTTDLSIDDIQQLTYQNCFMYFNWTDSIRVPATCQYAHKVAFLIGQAVHQYPSDHLKNKLFYL